MKIYVIVRKESHTSGHGSSDVSFALAGDNIYNPKETYPVFKTEQAAKNFIIALPWSFGLDVVELELIE